MKVFCLLFSIILFANPLILQAQELKQEEALPELEIDFDKVINFDELEEEMIKMNIIDSIKPIPPTTFIIWLRIIGCPMANAYFAVRRFMRNSIHKIAAFFKLKSDVKIHEESPAQ